MLISAYDKTDRLREMRTRGREGVKNPENFAYVLNGSPFTLAADKAKALWACTVSDICSAGCGLEASHKREDHSGQFIFSDIDFYVL